MIGQFLSEEAGQYRHLHRERVRSTNDELAEIARLGDTGNLWLTASEQSAGKGSRGREWVSANGNLFASLLLIEPSALEHFHELTFVTAVAARNALASIAMRPDQFQVKWPNDLLCNGKKCAGILLESGQVSRVPYVIAGIGINITVYPEDTLHEATCLADERIYTSAETMFVALAKEMAMAIQQWDKGNGFHAILNGWCAHASGIGKPVNVKLPTGEAINGRFASIDNKGYMMLETADGTSRKISTADVFFAGSDIKE